MKPGKRKIVSSFKQTTSQSSYTWVNGKLVDGSGKATRTTRNEDGEVTHAEITWHTPKK